MNTELTTLPSILNRSAELNPEMPALVERGGSAYTYRELKTQVEAVSRILGTLGIRKNDKVALLSENSPRWGLCYLAITAMGATVLPILPDFSRDEVQAILEHAGATGVCATRSQYQKTEGAKSAEFVLLLEDWVSVTPQTSYADLPERPKQDGKPIRLEATTVAPTDTSDGKIDEPPEEDDLAAILYTSGTTGKPKGVMLTHRNLVQNVIGTSTLIDLGPEDRLLSILPLAHTYECTIGFLIPLAAGATVYYLGGPPVLSTLLPAMQEVRPTYMLTVPLIMEKVYDSRVRPLFNKSALMRVIGAIPPARRLLHRIAGKKVYRAFGGALRFFGIGGAPLSAETEQFLREAKFPYSIGYGLTETSPLIAGTWPSDTRYRSTGPAIPNIEVRLDTTVGDEGSGEIQVRGPSVFQGYYRNEEATRRAFTDDGWFRTGDIGEIDDDGYIYVKSRLKNVILGPSGENIYPEDIEEAINQHELVRESLVFQWQGELVAKVHLDPEEVERQFEAYEGPANLGEWVDELLQSIRSTVNQRVGRMGRVGKLLFEREPFEKTPTKKIRRFLYTTLQGNPRNPQEDASTEDGSQTAID